MCFQTKTKIELKIRVIEKCVLNQDICDYRNFKVHSLLWYLPLNGTGNINIEDKHKTKTKNKVKLYSKVLKQSSLQKLKSVCNNCEIIIIDNFKADFLTDFFKLLFFSLDYS